jgi:hypothetical protein
MRKTAKQKFIASVGDDYLERMEEIADVLRSKGCVIHEILLISGVITGEIRATDNLDDLHVEGISSIEKERILKKK